MGTVTNQESIIQNAVAESKEQLAKTIAKMAEGVMHTHGIIMPRDHKREFQAITLKFISEKMILTTQIENQIKASINRPPAA
jgi:hypothetical protein